MILYKYFSFSQLIPHPSYNPNDETFNVGLINLTQAVTVRPAVLIKSGQEVARNECSSASYGPLEVNGTYPNPLHIVRLPLLCQPEEKELTLKRAIALTGRVFRVPSFVKTCNTFYDQLLFAGYLQSDVYKGPCGHYDPSTTIEVKLGELGSPLQCSLVGDNGDKTKQVLVGFNRFDNCNEDLVVNLAPQDRVPAAFNSLILFTDFIKSNVV
jgi:hypothetical protein